MPSAQSPESPSQQLPGAAPAAAPTPETAAQAEPSGALPVPSSEPGGQAEATAAGTAGGNPSPAELPVGGDGAGHAVPGAKSVAGAEVPGSASATPAAAAPQEAAGRAPRAAGVPHSAAQSVGAIVRSQPELEAVMIGLGVGLVGLAAAAGAAYFRMRKP